jgi:hypothetical protein
MVRRLMASTAIAVMLIFSFGLAASGKNNSAQETKEKTASNTVYVCSCMKTKSCPCMTEANMAGKCACGEKSPDMKEVARNSAWARHNRMALAGVGHTAKKM